MAKILKVEFGIGGADYGTYSLPCNTTKSLLAKVSIWVGWNAAEVAAGDAAYIIEAKLVEKGWLSDYIYGSMPITIKFGDPPVTLPPSITAPLWFPLRKTTFYSVLFVVDSSTLCEVRGTTPFPVLQTVWHTGKNSANLQGYAKELNGHWLDLHSNEIVTVECKTGIKATYVDKLSTTKILEMGPYSFDLFGETKSTKVSSGKITTSIDLLGTSLQNRFDENKNKDFKIAEEIILLTKKLKTPKLKIKKTSKGMNITKAKELTPTQSKSKSKKPKSKRKPTKK